VVTSSVRPATAFLLTTAWSNWTVIGLADTDAGWACTKGRPPGIRLGERRSSVARQRGPGVAFWGDRACGRWPVPVAFHGVRRRP